jgi:hypothetical protein
LQVAASLPGLKSGWYYARFAFWRRSGPYLPLHWIFRMRRASPHRIVYLVGLAMLLRLGGCELRAATAPADAGGRSPAIFYVYHDGLFAWPGDYSFVATPDYRDTSGSPQHGRYDIKVTLSGAWGGWQPYATKWVFDTKPYTYLRFALKPTIANQKAQVYFMLVGDKPVGTAVDPFKYGPAPVAGRWAVYTIPLADIGVAKTKIYKFAIQDQTGLNSNTFYVNDVAFVAEGGRP